MNSLLFKYELEKCEHLQPTTQFASLMEINIFGFEKDIHFFKPQGWLILYFHIITDVWVTSKPNVQLERVIAVRNKLYAAL